MMGNADDGRIWAVSNGSPGLRQGSPRGSANNLARRALNGNGNPDAVSTSLGVRRMSTMFGVDQTPLSAPSPYLQSGNGTPNYGPGLPTSPYQQVQQTPSQTSQYFLATRTTPLGRQTTLPPSTGPSKLDESTDVMNTSIRGSGWRFKSKKPRWWIGARWKIRQESERLSVLFIILIGCFIFFAAPRIFGISHPNGRSTFQATPVETDLTHLTLEEVLDLRQRDRVNIKLEPRILSGLRLAEWGKTRLEEVRPRVSLLAACKDRTSSLLQTLPTWQAALGPTDEIIIVDWSTAEDLLSVHDHLQSLKDPRLFAVRVEGEKQWILSLAYNLAAQFATGSIILKVDCDTQLHSDFLQQHPITENDNYFYHVSYERTRNENEVHLSGVLLTPKRFFDEVRGYDERIQAYGWDDTDFYTRIREMSVTSKDIDLEFVKHLEHEDVVRAADKNDMESPMFHTQSPKGNYAIARYTKRVKSLEAIIPNAIYRGAEKTAYQRVLHDAYGIPWGVLNEIEDPFLDVLSTLQHFGALSDWRKKGAIFGEVRGTPAQRLLALTSLIAVAVKYDRVLFVSWSMNGVVNPKDKTSTPVKLSDMFDWAKSGLIDEKEETRLMSRIFPIHKLKCTHPGACASADHAWKKIADGNNETELVMTLRGQLPEKEHVLLRLEGSLRGLTGKELLDAYHRLVPSTAILSRVNNFKVTLNMVGVYVGMHMRAKQISSFAGRVKNLASVSGSEILVVGSEMAEVASLRRELEVTSWEDDVQYDSETPYERIVREVAELYALGRTRKILKDGRCPAEIQELITILNQENRDHAETLTLDRVHLAADVSSPYASKDEDVYNASDTRSSDGWKTTTTKKASGQA